MLTQRDLRDIVTEPRMPMKVKRDRSREKKCIWKDMICSVATRHNLKSSLAWCTPLSPAAIVPREICAEGRAYMLMIPTLCNLDMLMYLQRLCHPKRNQKLVCITRAWEPLWVLIVGLGFLLKINVNWQRPVGLEKLEALCLQVADGLRICTLAFTRPSGLERLKGILPSKAPCA